MLAHLVHKNTLSTKARVFAFVFIHQERKVYKQNRVSPETTIKCISSIDFNWLNVAICHAELLDNG